MSKWKCGICNSEFENYHAQGFDNIIYCPLCYYKELYKRDKKEIDRLNNIINELENIRKEAIAFVKNNKDKTIAPYGDNEDTDYEVCLFENDINDLLKILNKGSEE